MDDDFDMGMEMDMEMEMMMQDQLDAEASRAEEEEEEGQKGAKPPAAATAGGKRRRSGEEDEDDNAADDELLELARMQDGTSNKPRQHFPRPATTAESSGVSGQAGSMAPSAGRLRELMETEELEDLDMLAVDRARDFLHPMLAPLPYHPPARSVLDIGADCESLMVTSQNRQESVYCGVRSPQPFSHQRQAELMMAFQTEATRGPMSTRPFTKLLAEVEGERIDRALKESAELANGDPAGGRSNGPLPEEELWVNKYSPAAYLELLSDEQTNREILKWIKAWDKTVFHSNSAETSKPAAKKMTMAGRRPGMAASETQDTRPDPRVILLAGPPGVGKTTLVHVLARHCGYRPFEINASDDRSAGVLGQRIRDAVTMQSVLGERKPNLVVVDEVDGAVGGGEGKSAVSALLKIVSDGGPRSSKETSAGDEGKEGGEATANAKKRRQHLSRPIICICNDAYVPALKPLREAGRLFTLNPPKVDKLLARLLAVCASEGVKVSRQVLSAIIEKSGSDIRSCLNSLQLLAGRGGEITLESVKNVQVSSKDIERSAFKVWEELLLVPSNAAKGRKTESAVAKFNRKLQTISNFGDNDLVLAGCHENMYNMNYQETRLKKTTALAEWMAHSDIFNRTIFKRSDYSIMAYMPVFSLAVSSMVASISRQRPQWPKAIMDNRRRRAANANLVASWVASCLPAVQVGLNSQTATMDVLPPLLNILRPDFKTLTPHLMSSTDSARLAALVDTLIGYGLTFSVKYRPFGGPHDQSGGGSSMPLSPAVNLITDFPGVKHDHRQVSEDIWRQIGHEVNLETIRRASKSKSEEVTGGSTRSQGAPAGTSTLQLSVSDRIREAAPRRSVPQMPAQAPAGPSAVAAGASWLDTFRKQTLKNKSDKRGGPSASQAQGTRSQALQGKHGPVLYKFHEGYTNAVKRVLKMSDLLQV